MAKAYAVVCYHSVSDEAALKAYAKLAAPVMEAAGGRALARGMPAKTYESGLEQRTLVVEFPSMAEAIAAHESPAYKAALEALGDGAKRDVRLVEGID
ncbi:MAG: DUF1330 domain-containing protein [Caldimonas sp.]